MYWQLGGAEPSQWAEAKAQGKEMVSNHSALFAPDAAPAVETGTAAEVAAVRLFGGMSAEEIRRVARQ